MTTPDETDAAGFAGADVLLLLPFVWQLALAPWANTVSWAPFGLPFMMVWQMAGILFTTACLAWRYRLASAAGTEGGDGEDAA